jgi:AraC family transcriptional regulator
MATSLAPALRTSLLPYFSASDAPAAAPGAVVTGLAPWQARSVMRTMLEQLAAKVPTTALASECGLSRGHFSRAFKKTFGLPPHSWRQLQRIALAKTMLLDGRHALADIAVHCGFSDQAHFTRAFKAGTGSTPLAWRRLCMARALPGTTRDLATTTAAVAAVRHE